MNGSALEISREGEPKDEGYDIIDTNADNIGGCSFCGYKDANHLGHRRKTDWLKER